MSFCLPYLWPPWADRWFVSDSFQVFPSQSCTFSKLLLEMRWMVDFLIEAFFSICTLSRICLCSKCKKAVENYLLPGHHLPPPPPCPLLLLLRKVGLWSLKLICHICLLRSKTSALTDDRIKTMSEVITGIRTIKVNAWEKSFIDLITRLRR